MASASGKLFPDAPAVVVQWKVVWTNWARFNTSEFKFLKSIEIRNEGGFDQANQVFFFSPDREDLMFFKAFTLQPDGTEVPLPKELIQEKAVVRSEDHNVRMIQFTFPAVGPGSIIHWEYGLKQKYYVPVFPHDGGWWEVQGRIPVVDASFINRFKDEDGQAGWGSRIDFSPYCVATTEKEFEGYFRNELRCHEIPAFQSEDFSPPENDTRLRFFVDVRPSDPNSPKTIADLIMGRWERSYSSFTNPGTETAKLASTIVSKDAPFNTKIDQVYSWVQQNLVHDPWSSDEAKNVDGVLEAKRGPGWQITFLMRKLFQSLGMDSRLAFFADRSEKRYEKSIAMDWQLPDLGLVVVDQKKAVVIDPVCDFCHPGVVDWPHAGNGSGAHFKGAKEIMAIDPAPADVSVERRQITVSLDPGGAGLVEGAVSWKLNEDVTIRRRWKYLTDAGKRNDLLRRIGGVLHDVKVEIPPVEERNKNLIAQFSCRVENAALSDPTRLFVRPVDDVSANFPSFSEGLRHQPVWFAYPRSTESTTVFRLPPGSILETLPPPERFSGPGTEFQGSWTKGKEPGSLEYKATVILRKDLIPPEEFSDLRAFFARVRRSIQSGVVVSLTTSTGTERER